METIREGVSLIICTFNGARRLPVTLQHILDQSVPEHIFWELILVDNGSSDHSAEVAEEICRNRIPFRVVTEQEPGLMYSRLAGIRNARYDFISFIDDDNWPCPEWVSHIYRVFREHPQMGLCGGQLEGVFETRPPDWFFKISTAFALGKQWKETSDITDSRKYVWGAGLSFRKPAFESLMRAGFNYILSGRKGNKLSAGEDKELAYAFRLAGYRIWYFEELKMRHFIPSARIDWSYTKKMFMGFGEAEFVFDLYKSALRNHSLLHAKTLVFFRVISFATLLLGWWFLTLHPAKAGNIRYLSYLDRKAYILYTLEHLSETGILYSQIMALKKKLA